ncbi:MAG: YcbK family protein [Alphaproteobacteria bacterium]
MQESDSAESTKLSWGENVERRDVLKAGLAGILLTVVPLVFSKNAFASATGAASWGVSVRHAHTGETFSGVYRVGNQYLPDAFKRLNYVLRDFRTNQQFPMDPHVLDIVSMIQQKSGQRTPVDVLSGYRSPHTNSMLRHASARTGVAKNSLHMYGQAMDIRLNDTSCSQLCSMAKNLKAGGVGYYPRSNFVHVDTGAVRYW